MDLANRLDELKAELKAFTCRPSTLISDLVLVALGRDLFETGLAIQQATNSDLPHKAYSNARLAFETAQNILVLATHEDYQAAGAVAWVYFESKDAGWRSEVERNRSASNVGPTEDEWLDRRVEQMARMWDSVIEGRGDLLRQALVSVRRDRKKRPDNWLHENMSRRHDRSYTLFARSNGNSFSAASADLNEKMYQALCRETHVRPRLDSFGVIHNRSDNTVRIDILPRNLEGARNALIGGTELAVHEGVAALRWQRTGAV
jgi:hypothetical protein